MALLSHIFCGRVTADFPDLEDQPRPRRGPSRHPPAVTLDLSRVPPSAPTSASPPAPPPVDCCGQCHGHGSHIALARHSERGRIRKMGEPPSREAFAAPQCPHGRYNAGEIRGRALGGRWCRRAGRGRTGGEVVIVRRIALSTVLCWLDARATRGETDLRWWARKLDIFNFRVARPSAPP